MRMLAGYFVCAATVLSAQTPQPPQTAVQRIGAHFANVNRQVLEMAQDFPEEKYGFKLTKEMRSFGEVIVHIASGNVFGAKAGRGEKVKWDEMNAADYHTKAEIVAMFQKTADEAAAALKANPEGPKKNLEPWMSVMEHSAEHYGLLVAYYRANGLVPPQSRPKK